MTASESPTDKPGSRQNLTRATASGIRWVSLASGVVLAASLASNLIVAWFLDEEEFGLFAIAMSAVAIANVFKDGGIRIYLSRQTSASFASVVGDAFWFVGLGTLSVAAMIGLGAPFVGELFNEPDVVPLVWVLGGSLPFGALAAVALPKLQVDLRFGALAGVTLGSGLVRFAATVYLAVAGFGALSLVLPILLSAIFESVAASVLAGIRPWRSRPSWVGMRHMFSATRWIIGGAAIGMVQSWSDYLALGLLVSVETVGIYYFSFQLSFRLVMVLQETMRQVLVPVFARLQAGTKTWVNAVERSVHLTLLAVAPAFFTLALVADPLEELLWDGRWEAAVGSIQVFSTVGPLLVLNAMLYRFLEAAGLFRAFSVSSAIRGAGVTGVAIVAGLATDGPAEIAALMAVFFLVAGFLELVFISPILRANARRMVTSAVAALSPAALAAVVVAIVVPYLPDSRPLFRIGEIVLMMGALSVATLAMFRRQSVADLLRLIRMRQTAD